MTSRKWLFLNTTGQVHIRNHTEYESMSKTDINSSPAKS